MTRFRSAARTFFFSGALVLLHGAIIGGLLLLGPGHAFSVSPPPLQSNGGMVAADNPLASQAGAEILSTGGNASDAAVGVAAVLGVLHPFASGMGGGGFCLYYDAETSSVSVYDFRETTPAAGSPEMFLDDDGNAQPELSKYGGMAVGVPGEVAGMAALHQDHGQRPYQNDIAAAIALARYGYPAGSLLVERIEREEDRIRKVPALKAWLMPEDKIPAPGDVLKNEALADTLEAIAFDGPTAFYEGERAKAIATAVQEAGGIMTVDDLAGYQISRREPVSGVYRGYEVYSMPPPSSGGIAVIEILNILQGFEMASMGRNSSRYIHHLVEAMKFAFADRAEFLGDPDFVEIPQAKLISTAYADELRDKIDPDSVLPLDAYGPDRYAPDDHGTSHFSIIDADGNAASCTSTINTSFGSFVFVDEAGLVLNNELDDFVQKPGVPNTYGLVGSAANAPDANKRPLSSMSPTLLMKDGKVVMAVGASGGPMIISGVVQTIINVIDLQLSAREAVEAPRVHHQWRPNTLFVESEIPTDVLENLKERGHTIDVRKAWSAVQIVTSDGTTQTGASDPRKHGQPAAEPVEGNSPLTIPVLPR